MRILPICCLALAVAAPALAQEKTTLEHMIARGSVLKAGGMEFPTTYTPDGKFTAAGGQVTGTWRIVGETLCVTTNYDANEACTLYPAGKKPGDEFEIASPQGAVTIVINK